MGTPCPAMRQPRPSFVIEARRTSTVRTFCASPVRPRAARSRSRHGLAPGRRIGTATPSAPAPCPRVIEASFEAAWAEASSPGALAASGSAAERVKRERVEGAVKVEYQSSSSTSVADLTPMLTTVEGQLAPLLTVANVPHALVV